jgi:acyl-CoA thioester hydrolase
VIHEKRIEIRWADIDAYGHVNNAVYLSYLEDLRDEWLARVHGERDAILKYVLVRVAIDYRRELTLADDVAVGRCSLIRVGTSSVTTREEILTADGQLAAEAEAVIVARDPGTGRSRSLTEEERAALERAASPPQPSK